MLRILIDEDYLKGYSPKLTALLWTDETDYSEQKKKAANRVFNALKSKGYNVSELMPLLSLRSSGTSLTATNTTTAIEDTISRTSLVIDNITNTVSSKTMILQGSEDNVTFYDIETLTVKTTDTILIKEFLTPYKYYRINTTVINGAIDFNAYVYESVYNELFACMWLYFIFMDISKASDDQFDKKAKEYYTMFETIMNETKFYSDTDDDGIPDKVSVQNSITMLK
jgi:hypothetical protein